MAQSCDSCGQPLSDGPDNADAIWLDPPISGAREGSSKSAAGRTEQRGGRSDKRLLYFLAAAAVVWAAFIGLGRVVTPDDSIDEAVAQDFEDARVEREVARALAEAEAERVAAEEAAEAAAAEAAAIQDADADEPTDVYTAADAAPGVPLDDSAGRSAQTSMQVQAMQRQLAGLDGRPHVAYLSNQGVVIIDLVASSVTVSVSPEEVLAVPPDSHMLRVGPQTFAVDPRGAFATKAGDQSRLVITAAADGSMYIVDPATLGGRASIIEVVVDGEYGFFRPPNGDFALTAIDGLGLLAVPQSGSGASLLAVDSEFVQLSAVRILAGSSGALLEQQCETTSCSLILRTISGPDLGDPDAGDRDLGDVNFDDVQLGEPTLLPPSFVQLGDNYAVAPDGQAVVRHSPDGYGEVFLAESGSVLWAVGAGMHSPAWSSDGSFFAWIDEVGDPELRFMFPFERERVTVDLVGLGAPRPTRPELLVFTADDVEAAD